MPGRPVERWRYSTRFLHNGRSGVSPDSCAARGQSLPDGPGSGPMQQLRGWVASGRGNWSRQVARGAGRHQDRHPRIQRRRCVRVSRSLWPARVGIDFLLCSYQWTARICGSGFWPAAPRPDREDGEWSALAGQRVNHSWRVRLVGDGPSTPFGPVSCITDGPAVYCGARTVTPPGVRNLRVHWGTSFMRELETSLQQFSEFLLKARLVEERAAPCCVRRVRRFLTRPASNDPPRGSGPPIL